MFNQNRKTIMYGDLGTEHKLISCSIYTNPDFKFRNTISSILIITFATIRYCKPKVVEL